ncbi:MAG: hypothetical protein ACTSWD_04845 [Candidatus Heimdallarchaeota archaeon]
MIVIFKSNSAMFTKEINGVKPNTVRKIDNEDKRFELLKRWDGWTNLKTPSHICIEHSETGVHFVRKIEDVTIFEGYMMISWRHEE